MELSPPRVTIYSRTLDNITNDELEGYTLINRNSHFHFGKINGISGGESSIVVEFDIWNNEPAIMGGLSFPKVSDAVNCRFTAWDDESLTSSKSIQDSKTYTPYVNARCVTQSFDEFQPIGGARYFPSEKIFNSVSSTPGFISGQSGGDHIKIQTKIIVPKYHEAVYKNFVFEFTYNYV